MKIPRQQACAFFATLRSRPSGSRSRRKQLSLADRLEVFLEGRERAFEIAQNALGVARVEAGRLALRDDLALPRDDLAAFLHMALRDGKRIDGHASRFGGSSQS